MKKITLSLFLAISFLSLKAQQQDTTKKEDLVKYEDLMKYVLIIVGSLYFILAERGIIKLPSQKRQQEFDARMRNRAWKYPWLTLAYLLIGYSIFLIVKDLYK
jgi:hypothetical protein